MNGSDFWNEAEHIVCYTREMALSDGVLIPIDTDLRLDAGYQFPVDFSLHLATYLEQKLAVPGQSCGNLACEQMLVLVAARGALMSRYPHGALSSELPIRATFTLGQYMDRPEAIVSFDGESFVIFFPEDD